jgi:hypothetical protein
MVDIGTSRQFVAMPSRVQRGPDEAPPWPAVVDEEVLSPAMTAVCVAMLRVS